MVCIAAEAPSEEQKEAKTGGTKPPTTSKRRPRLEKFPGRSSFLRRAGSPQVIGIGVCGVCLCGVQSSAPASASADERRPPVTNRADSARRGRIGRVGGVGGASFAPVCASGLLVSCSGLRRSLTGAAGAERRRLASARSVAVFFFCFHFGGGRV